MCELIDVYAVLEQIETIAKLYINCDKTEKDTDTILLIIKSLVNIGFEKLQDAEATEAEPNTANK